MTEEVGDALATNLGKASVVVLQDEDFLAATVTAAVIAVGVGRAVGLRHGLAGHAANEVLARLLLLDGRHQLPAVELRRLAGDLDLDVLDLVLDAGALAVAFNVELLAELQGDRLAAEADGSAIHLVELRLKITQVVDGDLVDRAFGGVHIIMIPPYSSKSS